MFRFFLTSLILFCDFAFADSRVAPRVTQELKKRPSVEAIVYFRDQADLRNAVKIKERTQRLRAVREKLIETAQSTQSNMLQVLKSEKVQHQAFYIENAIAIYELSPALLKQILKDPEVSFVGYNASAKLVLPPNETGVEPKNTQVRESLRMVNAHRVWEELGVKGRGIVVAGQDTGYRWSHRALKHRYRGFQNNTVDHNYNWYDAIREPRKSNCGSKNIEPCDDNGHGTHTMGTILGSDGDKIIGMAPEAQWIGCRNMADGDGTVATYLTCFEFFLAPFPIGGVSFSNGRPELAPHIVNNSWACPTSEGCTGGEFLSAIRALNAAGIFTVVAASNNGPGCGTISSPPAIYSAELLAVGAYNHYLKEIAFFSSRGPSTWDQGLAPHVTAPGTGIYSAVHTGDSAYDDKSGTSMASPHVAGAIALLWSARPHLIGDIEKTREIIQKSAAPMTAKESCGSFAGGKIPNAVFGYGMLDAYAAIQSAPQQ